MKSTNNPNTGLVIGIDGTNLRQGGGITHIIELLRAACPYEFGISKFVLWANSSTLAAVEDRPWLEKINPKALDESLIKRILWQKNSLSKAVELAGCDLLFVPGGSNASNVHPMVTMSRNMLPFELHELNRYGWSLKKLRLLLLRFWQTHTYRHADAVIFLTQYAYQNVLKITGELPGQTRVIAHGLNARFQAKPKMQRTIAAYDSRSPYRFIYVSVIDQYKHQWHVVEAVAALRLAGLPVVLDLIGPAYPPALERLKECLAKWDPDQSWAKYHGATPYEELHLEYAKADLGIFASSCENMPNILLETMASGLPVACSNRGPMPEVLGDAGEYFDPEKPEEIASVLAFLLNAPQRRAEMAHASYQKSLQFTWQRCANDTLAFLSHMARQHKRGGRG